MVCAATPLVCQCIPNSYHSLTQWNEWVAVCFRVEERVSFSSVPPPPTQDHDVCTAVQSKFIFQALTLHVMECFYDSPPPMPATVSKPIPCLSSLIHFFSGPTCPCGCFSKCKSIAHFFFKMAASSGEYSLFSGSCNRRFGGGAIVETHNGDERRKTGLLI